ncbi:glutamate synthase-related protein [Desulfospira joergensenii]|uniref:glutamate synthase-related protein n=1 Tax=Desulfospira joergensenii TaxID=53329 RepID=UPI0003B5CAF8|nr:glutamate synthase-related protein [Desulfospira joergensenii]
MATIDLSEMPIRTANEVIRGYGAIHEPIEIINPDARHYIGVGLTNPVDVSIHGSAGYFCGGLSDGPFIRVEKNVSWGVGDNMLAGTIVVGGNAGAIAGVALRGGNIIIKGNMGSRSGQVMKKGTLCCAGNSSFMAGYMMYGGRIIILGDSGDRVGENMAGGEIFVGGEVSSLGSDARLCEPTAPDLESIHTFLKTHGLEFSGTFKKIVCHGRDLTYGTPEPPAKKIPFPKFSGADTPYWNEKVQEDIRVKSRIGRYRVRGFGASRHVPHFNDIAFKKPMDLTAVDKDVASKVNLRTFIGDRHGGRALDLSMPVMIAPMSFGALSPAAKQALGIASSLSGISENTGEGGMYSVERAEARQLIAQCLSGRLGWNIHDMKRSDGLELYVSQGAKPGLGGQLMAAKLTKEIAAMRGIPEGMDLRSPSRHPDVLGGDDLIMKIREFREAVGWRLPVSIKLGAGRTRDDVKIAYKDMLDFVELDGLQGGTGAGGNEVLEYVGIPTISAIMEAMDGLAEIDAQGELPIVLMGGIQTGVDAAKAIALGATAVGVGTPMLLAGGCIGCMKCSSGSCPVGLATQDPKRVDRFDVQENARRMHFYLESMRWQMAAIASGLGHTSIHDLCREDLVALTPEAAALTRLPYVPEMRSGQKESLDIKSETGTANYPKKSFDLIRGMAESEPSETDKQAQLLTGAMVSRENPFPLDRPAHLDDIVFLSAALTRLVIDPYREECSTRTKISRSLGLGLKKETLPEVILENPFLVTGFDSAPVTVKKGLSAALSQTGCGYLGRTRLNEGEDPSYPWLQLLTAGDKPEENADGLIYVAGNDLQPGEIRRFLPNQILGLCVRGRNLTQSLDFALENKFDIMILDQSKDILQDWVELDSPVDLTLMRDAVQYLRSIGKEEEIALVNFGGMRSGTDVAKALAYNCTASVFGTAMGLALGGEIKNNSMGFKDSFSEQDLCEAAVKWIRGTAQETAIIARCAGKTNVHNLEPEDMRTITLAASKALDLPLASGPLKREDF